MKTTEPENYFRLITNSDSPQVLYLDFTNTACLKNSKYLIIPKYVEKTLIPIYLFCCVI